MTRKREKAIMRQFIETRERLYKTRKQLWQVQDALSETDSAFDEFFKNLQQFIGKKQRERQRTCNRHFKTGRL